MARARTVLNPSEKGAIFPVENTNLGSVWACKRISRSQFSK